MDTRSSVRGARGRRHLYLRWRVDLRWRGDSTGRRAGGPIGSARDASLRSELATDGASGSCGSCRSCPNTASGPTLQMGAASRGPTLTVALRPGGHGRDESKLMLDASKESASRPRQGRLFTAGIRPFCGYSPILSGCILLAPAGRLLRSIEDLTASIGCLFPMGRCIALPRGIY